MGKQATNRTHLTAVNGDTVQQFTITQRHPAAKPQRMYYWQGDNHILRTQGAYNGKLLDGPYQLTNRNEQLLGSGTFHKGLKTGLWRTWRPDGTLITQRHWHQGQLRGRVVEYDQNGQPLPKTKATPKAQLASQDSAAQPAQWWQLAHWKKRSQATAKLVPPPTAPASTAVSPAAAPPTGAPPAKERGWRRLFKARAPKPPKP